jgi:hypothetical protein
MRVSRRVINSKQHTVGYVLSNGDRVTRSEAVRRASRGDLDGVRVVNGTPRYIMSTTDRSLYDLPEVADSAQASRSRRR